MEDIHLAMSRNDGVMPC